ncbi:MAG: alcohol dehydrogenase [Acidimicrobiia bacterium]|nr:MAG: alcohol dehydrogenase [Acidimicrobiia bacterium]
MRVVPLTRPGDLGSLREVELDDPRPGPGEVLIEVEACAVCRTDLQLCAGDLPPRRLPVVPGHQAVGRVTEVGPDSQGVTVGTRVGVFWLAGACRTCRFCSTGRENLCVAAEFTGWDRDGGFATRLVARADYVVPMGPGDPTELAPLLCGGVIGYRAFRRCGVEPGGSLGLYGFGASADLVLQLAVGWGCDVYVVTRSEQGRARALELGAAWVGSPGETPPVPLDGAITFAPVGRVVVEALGHVDRGATVVINAIHLDGIPSFDYGLLWWERSLASVANVTRRDAAEFLALASRTGIRTHPRPYPLAEASQALVDLDRGRLDGTAVLVP